MPFVYITCKNQEEASSIAKTLLEKKLIVCANMLQSTSMYLWEGNIEEKGEIVLIAKTDGKKYVEIQTEVENTHSYSIPCVCLIEAEANRTFSEWVESELN